MGDSHILGLAGARGDDGVEACDARGVEGGPGLGERAALVGLNDRTPIFKKEIQDKHPEVHSLYGELDTIQRRMITSRLRALFYREDPEIGGNKKTTVGWLRDKTPYDLKGHDRINQTNAAFMLEAFRKPFGSEE